MITADEARKIADSNMKDEHDSFLFKYAIAQIEIYVMATSRRGGRSLSFNVDTLSPGYGKTDLQLRKAIAEELRNNGFSYSETRRSIDCIWFEVSW